MTFNPDADVSNNKARSGTRTTAIVGGGAVGIGAIIVLAVNLLSGGDVDLSWLLGGQETTQSQEQQQQQPSDGDGTVASCDTGADANENDACRIAASSLAIDQFWAENVEGYREPTLTIVNGTQSTPCGTASNQVGPFYCPSDEGVYIDPTFFALMREQFGATAGRLAQLYVVAHEYGHHIQNITGTMNQYPNNGSGPDSNGVRMELQADCYAGAWVGAMTEQEDAAGRPYLQAPTQQELADALNAASTVGDDHIQQESGVAVNPESWTHGSSEQREKWFTQGLNSGITQCDTFSVPGNQL